MNIYEHYLKNTYSMRVDEYRSLFFLVYYKTSITQWTVGKLRISFYLLGGKST